MNAGLDYETKTLTIDNYALSLFRSCPRKFQERIINKLIQAPVDWTPGDDPIAHEPALSFGIAMHNALDVLFMHQNLNLAEDYFVENYTPRHDDTKRTVGRGIEVLQEYRERWKSDDDNYEEVICETTFGTVLGYIDIPGHGQWVIRYGGRIDKLIKRKGKWKIMDHKTSSWESQFLAVAYELNPQFLGYLYGAIHELNLDPDALIVDILLMKPKNNDFMRHEIRAEETKLEEWKQGIMQTAELILRNHLVDEFFRQDGYPACTDWNRLCPYFYLCNSQGESREGNRESLYIQDQVWDISGKT